ncbi:alpha/beta fold hydrolase [Pseudomaricurvus albidus]|uniref:alpha/beta fold hydrolase n=1 Tax=Pseudomaricurvus albidus TaxID=2842452 RepID=UPI001C0AE2A2|nr:alpha/beta hydrolase [Aestuariicella albida]
MMNTTPPEPIESDTHSQAVASTASSAPRPEAPPQSEPADTVSSPKNRRQSRHWVLLRGLSRDTRHWEAFPEQLQQAFPEDRVTCLNLPGTGPNHQFKSPARISQMVDWLREHYAASLKQQPLHLLTISMGGMLAADWMHRFPEEVAASVMINTSSQLSPLSERMRSGTLWAFLKGLLSSVTKREQIIVERTSNRHTDNADLTNRWRIYQQQQPVSASTIVKQLFAASQFQPQAISQPLLLLASRQDRVVNPKCSETLADFWSADLRMHKSAGHDIPLDDSEWLLTQLQLWLEKNEGNTALSQTKDGAETIEGVV